SILHEMPSGPTSPKIPAHNVSSKSVMSPFLGAGRCITLTIDSAIVAACAVLYGNPDLICDLRLNLDAIGDTSSRCSGLIIRARRDETIAPNDATISRS